MELNSTAIDHLDQAQNTNAWDKYNSTALTLNIPNRFIATYCTYPCQGGFGTECVSISSKDMLQLGVLLLSYMELLHDSVQQNKDISKLYLLCHQKWRKSMLENLIRYLMKACCLINFLRLPFGLQVLYIEINSAAYHLKKNWCLHGRKCLILIRIYLVAKILENKIILQD